MRQPLTVAFDADDTLWENEPPFRAAERELCQLLAPFLPTDEVSELLYQTEIRNLPPYGYGAKAFTLSLMETALAVGGDALPASTVARILALGRGLCTAVPVAFDGVAATLAALRGNGHRVVAATKGDLLDQERKFEQSGLAPLFDEIVVMTDKQPADYRRLFARLGVEARQVAMVGNSYKSDIAPVLALGGRGALIPFHTLWRHETADVPAPGPRFAILGNIAQVPGWIAGLRPDSGGEQPGRPA